MNTFIIVIKTPKKVVHIFAILIKRNIFFRKSGGICHTLAIVELTIIQTYLNGLQKVRLVQN